MEKREDALKEALARNEEEIQRWESYIKENEIAIECLGKFSKKLQVEVMVPIGRKALIPGRLIHTNEVLVGHYQDYFSKCSAYTATQICQKRIENGKHHLKEFEIERDLFQNNLEKPYVDGALPSSEQREIIEEYDDVKESMWREQHRKRVREAKLKEKQQRDEGMSKEKISDELAQKLEEEELLKELNENPSDDEMHTNSTHDIVHKLMSGELNLPPPKMRIAHNVKTVREKSTEANSIEGITISSSEKLAPNTNEWLKEDKADLKENPTEEPADGNESDTSITSETPEEICLIEKQAEYLPHSDRVGFLRYQLQIVNKKLTVSFTNCKELEEKLRLFKVRDHLEELIEISEETVSSETEAGQIDDPQIECVEEKPPKRRISFALEDQMLEFKKNEAVAQMIPIKYPTENNPSRDVIALDEHVVSGQQPIEVNEIDSNEIETRRQAILDRVEENMKTNNVKDVDIVTKIINADKAKTLHIYFKHSSEPAVCTNDIERNIPTNPGDLYKMCRMAEKPDLLEKQMLSSDMENTDGDAINVDSMTSAAHEEATNEPQCKSILKNKLAVQRETHISQEEEKKTTPTRKIKPKVDDDYLTAYNKVMGDVVEKPLVATNHPSEVKSAMDDEDHPKEEDSILTHSGKVLSEVTKKPKQIDDLIAKNEALNEVTKKPQTGPDPLPEGKFVDMHSPKNRISRFKQMRAENK